MEKPTFEEIERRITRVKSSESFSSSDAACWLGYIAALLEWGLLGIEDHRRLREMLPTVEPDPTQRIFLG